MGVRNGGKIRRTERVPLECPLILSWQLPNGETRSARATCRDVSKDGARLDCSEAVSVRSSVYVQAPKYGLMGHATVRYCRKQGLKNSIGLEFSWAAALAGK